jgi:hypothetical protein
MDDDRLDARLHEYATRWRSAQPPATDVAGAAMPRRRPVLLPALTAAAVAATVVGVGLARRDDAAPPVVAAPSPSATPVAETPCSTNPESNTSLRWSAGFSIAHDHHVTGNLVGELRVTNRGATACTVPDDVRITMRHGMEAIGVPYEDTPTPASVRLLPPATGMVKPLLWTAPAPLCGPEPIVVVMLIETGDEGFRMPIDRHVFPACRTPEHRATGVLEAGAWSRLAADEPCAMNEWGYTGSGAGIFAVPRHGPYTPSQSPPPSSANTQWPDHYVRIVVDLVNDAGRPCDIDVKPEFFIVVGNRRLTAAHVVTSDGRVSPPLPVGGQARAELFWHSYCGPPLEDYSIWVEIPGRPGATEVSTTGGKPAPSKCQPTTPEETDEEAGTSSGWIERR